MKTTQTERRPMLGHVLWGAQALLALAFLFAGVVKLMMPIEQVTQQVPVPGPFIRFISLAEVLGALGLALPGLLRIRPALTPLAAAGLVIIMAGATVLSVTSGPAALALIPLALGLLAAFVAYGRWRLAPLRSVARPSALPPSSARG